MRIPIIRGIIDRRILVNYRIDGDVMARHLPAPFRPQLVDGWAIGGICLIRLKQIRPRFFPFPWGIGSENAAHRIAVEWEVEGRTKQGVYIPRRDTNSRMNALAGGSIFPGIHHHASFTVNETESHFSVGMESDDGLARIGVDCHVVEQLSAMSVFPNLESASTFFELGSLGYSPTKTLERFDGLEMRCHNWLAQPLEMESVASSYFEDRSRFPIGSTEFDSALLMRGIDHEWHGQADLCC